MCGACRFLQADLAAVDRSVTPWIVLSKTLSTRLHQCLAFHGNTAPAACSGCCMRRTACMPDGHRPIYTTSVSPTVVSVAEQQRASFESLLVQYQVCSTACIAQLLRQNWA